MFKLKLQRNDIIEAFNSTSRYPHDLLNIDNIYLLIMIQFLQKYMINGMILILILLISRSLMAMSLGVPLRVFISPLIRFTRVPSHLSDFVTNC